MFYTPPLIVRQGLLEDPPLVSLSWSIDSASLLSLDVESTVRIWSLPHARGVPLFPPDGEFTPPEVMMVFSQPPIQKLLERNPPPRQLAKETSGISSKASKIGAKMTLAGLTKMSAPVISAANPADTRIYSIAFHPSMTIFGKQPSILVGLGGGVILKHNSPDAALCFDGRAPDVKLGGVPAELEFFVAHKWGGGRGFQFFSFFSCD
jgi:hypothetical protein